MDGGPFPRADGIRSAGAPAPFVEAPGVAACSDLDDRIAPGGHRRDHLALQASRVEASFEPADG